METGILDFSREIFVNALSGILENGSKVYDMASVYEEVNVHFPITVSMSVDSSSTMFALIRNTNYKRKN
mgnify:CR=1 FL=1